MDDHRHMVSAVLDAWTIVDSVHRLRGLVAQTPHFKQKGPNLRLFRDRTVGVKDLRNSVQHLNHEVDQLLKQNLPVWGVLRWFAILDADSHSGWACTLRTGIEYQGYTSELKVPLNETVSAPIDKVMLQAHGRALDLSAVMVAVEKFANNLVEQIGTKAEEQWLDLPMTVGDVMIGAKVGLPATE